MNLRIPLAKPEITDADRDAVMEVLHTPHLSMGPKLHEFEQAICKYTGSKYAVAVNSGTSALHLAVRALGIERGAEVILPSFGFAALLNVVLQEGLRPRFVDIDPATFNTTPELVAAAISSKTRLVLAVHTFGVPVDVKRIGQVVKASAARRSRRAIHVIEDACEALGTEVKGQKAGTLGEAGLFAFYPNKQITAGEGGVLVTAKKQIVAMAERLRNQGRDSARELNRHMEAGFSYRLSDINCALGVSQLARIEIVIARRQQLAGTYDRALARIAEVVRPPLVSPIGRISWFVYPVLLTPEFSSKHRNQVCEALLKKGIATARYFAPLHRQPVLRKFAFATSKYRLPQTEAVADRVIALPFFNTLTEAQIQEVAGALEESIREVRRKMKSKLPCQGRRRMDPSS